MSKWLTTMLIFITITLNGTAQLADSIKVNGKSTRSLRFIVKPNFSEIETDTNCIIGLSIKVDENGDIYGVPTVDPNYTETTDQELINKAITIVMKQAKYTSKKGAPITNMLYVINLKKIPSS